jgi:hypothetical protein
MDVFQPSDVGLQQSWQWKITKTWAFKWESSITCYHRSSVNIAFGVSRSELTKPGDQSMAGFDFIDNTIPSKVVIGAWLDLIPSKYTYRNEVSDCDTIVCFQFDFTPTS